MSDYIPAEIWPNILRNLSPETLIICLSVCKSWNSLISSSSFIASHLAIQKPLLIATDLNNFHEIELESRGLPVRSQPLSSFDFLYKENPHSSFRIIGSVNGVICLADNFLGVTETIILLNPLIRRCVYPPKPIYGMNYTSTLGFGSGSGSGTDLKIVRVARINTSPLFGRRRRYPPQAELFSIREQKWRSIDYGDRNCLINENQWSQCLLNGAAHWSAYMRSSRSVVLSFQFEGEEFIVMELPLELQREMVSVSKIGDMLSVLKYKHGVGVRGANGCDVWAMHEYGVANSWCKMVSLDWEGGGLSNVMWVKEDGQEMIVLDESGQVLMYDLSNRLATSTGVRCNGDGYLANGFVPSLLLFHQAPPN